MPVGGGGGLVVAFATSSGVISFLLRYEQEVLAKAAGVLLIIFGLHLSGVITIPFLEQERRWQYTPTRRLGYARSFLVGSAFSVGWTPCVGPTLGAILALAATSSTVWQGGRPL